MEKLLDPREVAAAWNVPVSWVYQKAEAGVLPSVKLGKYRRFDPVAVREWFERQRVDASR